MCQFRNCGNATYDAEQFGPAVRVRSGTRRNLERGKGLATAGNEAGVPRSKIMSNQNQNDQQNKQNQQGGGGQQGGQQNQENKPGQQQGGQGGQQNQNK
jgi:hypothetical protein